MSQTSVPLSPRPRATKRHVVPWPGLASGLRVQPFTILGWQVEDILAVTRQLTARGVQFLRPDGLYLDDQGCGRRPTVPRWPGSTTLTATPSLDHHHDR